MFTDRDLWKIAACLVDRFGDDALERAGFAADAAGNRGEGNDHQMWSDVFDRVYAMLNEEVGVTMH